MGLFDRKKSGPDTSIKYTNNITERLTSVLTPRFAKASVYLRESGDPKFVNIMVDGIDDVLGVITRDPKNVARNIGLYRKGVPMAFKPEAEDAIKVYENREISGVKNPY